MRVGEHDGRLECAGLFRGHECIRHDDYHVTRLNLACGSAIEANLALATLALDDISIKELAIVVVHDIHTLALNDAGGIQSLGGAKIELVEADITSDPAQAKTVVERLLSDDEIVGTKEKAGIIEIDGVTKTIVEFATDAEVTEMLDAALPAPANP